MRTLRVAVIAVAMGSAVLAPAALSSDGGSLGAHVSSCARESLGQRSAPPEVTCMEHSFPNFGQMVLHHREHMAHK